MRRLKPYLFAALLLPSVVPAQDPASLSPEQFGLQHLASYLGLKPSDISYRSDYTEPDGFRLKLVADLMDQPLGMIEYTENLKAAYVRAQPEILAGIVSSDLITEFQTERLPAYLPEVNEISELQNSYLPYYSNLAINRLLNRCLVYLDIVFPRSAEMMLAELNAEQRRFLTEQFKELIVVSVEEEFMTADELDAAGKREEAYVEEFVVFGGNLHLDPILRAGTDCLRDLMLEAKSLRAELRSGQSDPEQLLASTDLVDDRAAGSYMGKQAGWAIGGVGQDYYEGDYRFILDLGGDDIYDLHYDPSDPHGVIILDLSGNDTYRAGSDFALGSGCLSVGILLDFEGNDRYDGRSFSIGSGYFGFGVLYDAAGDDRYEGDTHVQGAGTFGLGLLIDEGGRDIYNAALYSQGFGFTEGFGLIYDADGSDSYYAGGKYKDHLRYEDHYLSLSQGFGYGLRPWMSGGVGAI
ncbi:MAG: hypothetical protein JSU65_00740, partial [Candidatus Zixiibacteriota bacterium]